MADAYDGCTEGLVLCAVGLAGCKALALLAVKLVGRAAENHIHGVTVALEVAELTV